VPEGEGNAIDSPYKNEEKNTGLYLVKHIRWDGLPGGIQTSIIFACPSRYTTQRGAAGLT
jgi:hypothetical protein